MSLNQPEPAGWLQAENQTVIKQSITLMSAFESYC